MKKFFCLILYSYFLSGCASFEKDPEDPFQRVNRAVFVVNDTLDTHIVKPTTMVYKGLTPSPVRLILKNVFNNIYEISHAMNHTLQGNFDQTMIATARLMINSTIGLFGVFDVASGLGIQPTQADFGQTLGKRSYEKSAYIMWPLFGPSTVRDSLGNVVDYIVSPISWVRPASDRYNLLATKMFFNRVEAIPLERMLEASSDKYTLIKRLYLQKRELDIKGVDLTDTLLDEPPE